MRQYKAVREIRLIPNNVNETAEFEKHHFFLDRNFTRFVLNLFPCCYFADFVFEIVGMEK